jgi:hypothetical protein
VGSSAIVYITVSPSRMKKIDIPQFGGLNGTFGTLCRYTQETPPEFI